MNASDPTVAFLPSIDTTHFRQALGCFVTGVTVMTARAADGRLAG
ncbi:hypothetical protein HDIA_3165 [Hartmannibacter diazotrophicus]|uniref:Flavin reductase n=1 Tax=Hartmannibacter diazotrophicus TaxID=1482074 RepID=A0A2C9D8X0_9HYPH|nr:hypothetical protein [Hartmannibacter diazotrophicus]SON56706.1 hypothetical protein HDIA_3165 [Hartmannibacter diazotrophicus]